MNLIKVLALSASSVVVLFILTKLMGNRQMSQLSMFDYINGITIGSIAAEMATSLESDYKEPLVAMLVYAAFSILISLATSKSIKIRRVITGKSLILLQDGKLYDKNIKKARLDLNEFLMECRNNGYFDLAELKAAVLESNGKISFLPLVQERPVNPGEMGWGVPVNAPAVNVIMDGKVMPGNLKYTGNNRNWLHKQLSAQGISEISNVFLATCDNQNNLSVYCRENEAATRDMFE